MVASKMGLLSLALASSLAPALLSAAPSQSSCGKPATGATGAYLADHPAASACGATKTSCEQMCRLNPRCKAWQWMQPSAGANGTAVCYLKSELGLAPNGASTSGELHRPPPPPPPPPVPPPPPFASRVSVDSEASRPVVLYGYGNELAFQSLNDTVLNKAIAGSGATVGRYPGGQAPTQPSAVACDLWS